ncbi:hypothetical protein EJV46_18680 [Roseococcus sp. SYP-B2431]|uniref:hypothetical protein n=1 Tax=Roseococcus sp. SYP-B2431 TaxID=2496640 RepID=UPI00103E1DDE|nr:hypothetical protein [Roseococcus sp. SYP-B2431]TCH96615.1 hypothetical protein EJV46_18680 [Roseococcus sp. SYP-B2431]
MTERLEPATVRWAYRFLLGRDPESDAVLDAWCGAGSVAGLMDGILTSPEMAGLALAGFPERGSWIESRMTDEAARAALILRDGAAPADDAVEELRLRAPSLRVLRQVLLASPPVAHRLPQPEGPRSRVLRLPGGEVVLTGDSREPEFLAAPGFAPRWARLLRAAWADGGEGRVILEDGAGIGVATLGLATGAPGHAALVAHEDSLRKAAALAENLAGNGLSRAASRAVPLGEIPAALAREGLGRLDALRLGGPGAARMAAQMAPWLLERGTLTIVNFDLTELVADPAGPHAALSACVAGFPHAVGFDAAHEPRVLLDGVALDAALRRALLRPDRRDEILLCPDLDWLERYAALL